jgi:hypothetical protein
MVEAVKLRKQGIVNPSLINIEEMLRRLFREEKPLVVEDQEAARIQKALFEGPVVIDFIATDDDGNELYRFYFLGRGNLKYPIFGPNVKGGPRGKKWGQEVQSVACPKCGKGTKLIIIEKRIIVRSRKTKEDFSTLRSRKAVLHCGKLRYLN